MTETMHSYGLNNSVRPLSSRQPRSVSDELLGVLQTNAIKRQSRISSNRRNDRSSEEKLFIESFKERPGLLYHLKRSLRRIDYEKSGCASLVEIISLIREIDESFKHYTKEKALNTILLKFQTNQDG
jgi:hypothetical protein